MKVASYTAASSYLFVTFVLLPNLMTVRVQKLEPTDELFSDTVNPTPDDPYGSSFKIG